MMVAYEIKEAQWAFKLDSPTDRQGAASLRCHALSKSRGLSQELTKAILARYNINEKTYRQWFRTGKLKNTETPCELVTRLRDIADKWMKGCKTAQEVFDIIVEEQLLNTLPEGIQVRLREH